MRRFYRSASRLHPMRLALLVVGAISLLPWGVPVATAGESHAEIESGATFFFLPQNQFFADRGESSPFARNDNLDTDDGHEGVGSHVGVQLGFDSDLSFAGSEGVGIELRGTWDLLKQDYADDEFTDPGNGTRYGWVVLDNSTGFGTNNSTLKTLHTKIRRNFDYWGGELLGNLDYGNTGETQVSIFAGPSFRKLVEKTDIEGKLVTTTTVNLDENLRTDYLGGKIGVSFRGNLAEDWPFEIETAFSSYHAATHYRGDYSDSSGNSTVQVREDSKIALGADLKAKVEYKITELISIGTFAGLHYMSYAPQMDYGSVPTDSANGVLRIGTGHLVSALVGAQLNATF